MALLSLVNISDTKPTALTRIWNYIGIRDILSTSFNVDFDRCKLLRKLGLLTLWIKNDASLLYIQLSIIRNEKKVSFDEKS